MIPPIAHRRNYVQVDRDNVVLSPWCFLAVQAGVNPYHPHRESARES